MRPELQALLPAAVSCPSCNAVDPLDFHWTTLDARRFRELTLSSFASVTYAAHLRNVLEELPSSGGAHVVGATPDIRGRFRSGVFSPDEFERRADPLGLYLGANHQLKTGGTPIVVCHNRRALANRLLGRRSPIFGLEHLQRFCGESLRRLLEHAGFTHIRLSAISNHCLVGYWARLFPLPGPLRHPAFTVLRPASHGPLSAFSLATSWPSH